MKTCSKCKISKEPSQYYANWRMRDGLASQCSKCHNSYPRNRERSNAYMKAWCDKNREKVRAYHNAYIKNRSKTDIQYKLGRSLRSRLWNSMQGTGISKRGSAVKLLGCSLTVFKEHLESLFLPGMTWDNHGEWHIDHIKPLTAFDLTDTEQLKIVCHYTNMQPLWASDNISKGGAKVA